MEKQPKDPNYSDYNPLYLVASISQYAGIMTGVFSATRDEPSLPGLGIGLVLYLLSTQITRAIRCLEKRTNSLETKIRGETHE